MKINTSRKHLEAQESESSSPSLARYIEYFKVQLEKAVYRSPLLKKLTISKKQMLIEVKIITGGIIDFIIDLLRSSNYDQLEANAHAIDDYLNRWMKLLCYEKVGHIGTT